MNLTNRRVNIFGKLDHRWVTAFAWILLGGLLLWLYSPLMVSMVENWLNDDNYSHGFFVPIVSAGLIWRIRGDLAKTAARSNWAGLIVVGLGLLILLIGQLGHEFFLRRISLIPVLWGLVFLYWGWAVAKKVSFPFGYLALMIPLPYVVYDSVAFPLRLVAASIAGWLLRLIQIPVLVEGNSLQLPYITLNVIDACSGIRSLISLLAVGMILAYLMLPSRWQRLLVLAMVLPVAVFANAVRVAVTGILAKYYGEEIVQGATHDTIGWIVFMVAFMILWGITLLIRIVFKTKEEDDAK